jgi:hypothetical protein
MRSCWKEDHHQRPDFGTILNTLSSLNMGEKESGYLGERVQNSVVGSGFYEGGTRPDGGNEIYNNWFF